ncbi:MAG: hypothetical protein JW889_06035 [Verrucomicrobia bacterium]|nr:hypothetical protein [Verrucomicrobiota bacterium]
MSAYGGVWWRVSFLWRTWAPGAAAFVAAVPVYAFSDVGILLPIGLVFCAFFGLAMLGVAWHIASSERRGMTAGRTLIYAALGVFILGSNATIIVDGALTSLRYAGALRNLTPDSVERVAVRG